jgi:signal peptidase II
VKFKPLFTKLLFLFIFLLIVDFASKYWTMQNIAMMSWLHPYFPYGGIGVFRFWGIAFSLNYVQNTGAAWGLFSQYPLLLVAARIIIVVVLAIYLLFYNHDKKKVWPLFLIITGAVGNIISYLLYGFVIDMFLFNFWGYSFPVFNVADMMISIGILWFLLLGIPWKKKKSH